MDEARVRSSLYAEREVTLARIRAMTTELQAIVDGSQDANSDDEHDPEGSTIAYERAQVASLLNEAKNYLDDLEQALLRLDSGRYSICDICGEQIAPERLQARPATTRCIQCARSRPTP
jgi:DnaK suppressor protein